MNYELKPAPAATHKWVVPPDRYCLSLVQPQFVSNRI